MHGPTMSGGGWSSILRGVESSKHKVFNNGEEYYKVGNFNYKSFLWHIKQDFGLKTLAAVAWEDLKTHLIETDATDEIRFQSDEDGTIWLEEELLSIMHVEFEQHSDERP